MNWYLKVLKQYADFRGRARRTEYWMFVLFNLIFSIAAYIVDLILGTVFDGNGLFHALYSLIVLIPSIAVSVRRLHDTGRSGWWLLIGLIPIIGWIVLIVFFLLDSQPGTNEYGPNPKES